MRKARVEVCESSLGQISIIYKGKKLDYRIHRQNVRQSEVKDSKQIAAEAGLKLIKKSGKKYIPPSDHAWRRFNFGSNQLSKPIEQK
jgi:hypothetical protein